MTIGIDGNADTDSREVLAAALATDRRYVKAPHLDDDVGLSTIQIGKLLTRLADVDHAPIEIYNDSGARNIYLIQRMGKAEGVPEKTVEQDR